MPFDYAVLPYNDIAAAEAVFAATATDIAARARRADARAPAAASPASPTFLAALRAPDDGDAARC